MKSLHLCLKELSSIFQVVSECVFAVASVRAREGRVEGGIGANQGVALMNRKSTSYERGQDLLTENLFLGNIIVSVQDPIWKQTYTSYFSKEFNMKGKKGTLRFGRDSNTRTQLGEHRAEVGSPRILMLGGGWASDL